MLIGRVDGIKGRGLGRDVCIRVLLAKSSNRDTQAQTLNRQALNPNTKTITRPDQN